MPTIMPQRTMELSQARTPDAFREMTWRFLREPLKDFRICGSEILFATYIESEITKGGIIKPNHSVQENLYQGMVGMVLMCGPNAFKYDRFGYKWESHVAAVNDWILMKFSDCVEIHINGVSCRVIDHENIRAILPTPDIITSDKR